MQEVGDLVGLVGRQDDLLNMLAVGFVHQQRAPPGVLDEHAELLPVARVAVVGVTDAGDGVSGDVHGAGGASLRRGAGGGRRAVLIAARWPIGPVPGPPALVRHGLRLILDAEPDLSVVTEAADGAEAVEAASADTVDLAILDIAMPRLTGIQAAREISQRAPRIRILMLSMYDNEQYFFESLKAGASGYVLKSVADRDLIEACRASMRGEPFLYPGAVTALIRDYLQRSRRGDRLPDRILTSREEEIVKLIAESHSSREIAATLGISVKTVDRHRANILQKLGMRDRLDLTRYAIRAGLVEP